MLDMPPKKRGKDEAEPPSDWAKTRQEHLSEMDSCRLFAKMPCIWVKFSQLEVNEQYVIRPRSTWRVNARVQDFDTARAWLADKVIIVELDEDSIPKA